MAEASVQPAVPDTTATRQLDARLLLALAALLIFNSHLEEFYPHAWMAGDGLLGNSIFFMLSGYGIQSSLQGRPQGFGTFASRRFWRLYPAVWIVGLLLDLPRWAPGTIAQPGHWFSRFIWPTPHTYVGSIVFFYATIYWLNRMRSRVVLWLAAVVPGAIFLIGGTIAGVRPGHAQIQRPEYLYWCFYGATFALGALAAAMRLNPRRSWLGIAVLLVVTVVYVATKFVMVKQHWATNASPILVPMAVLPAFLGLVYLTHPDFVRAWLGRRIFGGFLALVAALTFEIYIVHELLAWYPFFRNIRFPLNIVTLFVVTLAISWPLAAIVNALRDRVERRPEPRQPPQRPVPAEPEAS